MPHIARTDLVISPVAHACANASFSRRLAKSLIRLTSGDPPINRLRPFTASCRLIMLSSVALCSPADYTLWRPDVLATRQLSDEATWRTGNALGALPNTLRVVRRRFAILYFSRFGESPICHEETLSSRCLTDYLSWLSWRPFSSYCSASPTTASQHAPCRQCSVCSTLITDLDDAQTLCLSAAIRRNICRVQSYSAFAAASF